MESIMDAQGVWDAVDRQPDQEIDAKIGKRARAFILQSLPEDILLQVASHKDASELWTAIKTHYLGADRVQKARIQTLTREFELFSMKDTKSIDDLAGRITKVTSKIRALGEEVSSAKQVKKLLNAAPNSFLPIVAGIEQYSDLETMPFEEAIGRLKTYEERIKPKEVVKNPSGQLLFMRAKWEKSRVDTSFTGRGKGSKTGTQRQMGRSMPRPGGRGQGSQSNRKGDRDDKGKNNGRRDKKNIRCFNCVKLGHYASECKAPRRSEDGVNLVKDEDEPTLLIAMCTPKLCC